jgi:hypothetical protein
MSLKRPRDVTNPTYSGERPGAAAGPAPRLVKTQSAKKDVSKVDEITPEQTATLAAKARIIIGQETQDIRDAKAAANTLLSHFKERGVLDANEIMQRSDAKTANVFPFYIGRLNPPHLFHLLSLFTAIFIARQYGTKALFILGSGRAKAKRVSDPDPKIENPLPDGLKWMFITSKLSEFGFVERTDYEIVKLVKPKGLLATFVGKESKGPTSELPVTVVHIGGDKPEYKSGEYVLDVDKFDFLENDELFLNGKPATYKQAVIVSGESRVSVIDEKGQPEEKVMSASLLRKTACDCLKFKPDNPDKAFQIWARLFTPMYRDDVLSRDVFNTISVVTCGVAAAAPGGGSRRKHTIRRFRNKKTILQRMSRRGRVVSRNKTKRRK